MRNLAGGASDGAWQGARAMNESRLDSLLLFLTRGRSAPARERGHRPLNRLPGGRIWSQRPNVAARM